jgi:hypothetical protein
VEFWSASAHPMHAAGITFATLSIVLGLRDPSPFVIAVHNAVTVLVTGILTGIILAKDCFGALHTGGVCFIRNEQRCVRLGGAVGIVSLGQCRVGGGMC